eukprot:1289814-Pyramimonas_sp.AAC.1
MPPAPKRLRQRRYVISSGSVVACRGAACCAEMGALVLSKTAGEYRARAPVLWANGLSAASKNFGPK